MEFCNEETIEVFALEDEKGRDGASDDKEPIIMSTVDKRRRRVSDIIDSMGDDENVVPEGFMTPRRSSNRSTDMISPDQGYSATSELSTPESVNVFMQNCLTKAMDLLDVVSFTSSSEIPEVYSPRSSPEITASMPVDPDADLYNMNHKYRGKCVVFNHEKFDTGYSDRSGSSVDVKRIEQTFQNLGFTVEVLDNFKHAEVIDKLTQLSEEDHGEADCICIFMLTHGLSNDMIWAKDVAYKAHNIWKPFTADKCKTLAGKPKIFFFQACQGLQLDDGVTLTRNAMVNTETDSVDSCYKIPTHADFLIAHSTVQGFCSYRNPTEGTWFVQSLCEVLDQYADSTDLLKMMTITSRKIATTRASYDNVNPYKHDKKQVPSITSMLLREVYFPPKK